MNPATLDHINSAIETCGFLPTMWECWAVYRSKGATGSTLMSHAYWTAAGVWWLFYYCGLAQFWTMESIAVWLTAYSLKTALIVRYRYFRDTATLRRPKPDCCGTAASQDGGSRRPTVCHL